MKKFNACLTWLFIVLVITHACLKILTRNNIIESNQFILTLSDALLAVFIAHAVLSMIILAKTCECKPPIKYAKENQETIVQRATGIMQIVLLVPHFISKFIFASDSSPSVLQKVIVCIVETLFFYAVFDHIMASFTKSLITLGLVRNEKTRRKIDLVVKFGFMIMMLVTIVTMIIGTIRM